MKLSKTKKQALLIPVLGAIMYFLSIYCLPKETPEWIRHLYATLAPWLFFSSVLTALAMLINEYSAGVVVEEKTEELKKGQDDSIES